MYVCVCVWKGVCIYVRGISDRERMGYVGIVPSFDRVKKCARARKWGREREREGNNWLCWSERDASWTPTCLSSLLTVRAGASVAYLYITNKLQRIFIYYEHTLSIRILYPLFSDRSHLYKICRKLVMKSSRVLYLNALFLVENFVKNSMKIGR